MSITGRNLGKAEKVLEQVKSSLADLYATPLTRDANMFDAGMREGYGYALNVIRTYEDTTE